MTTQQWSLFMALRTNTLISQIGTPNVFYCVLVKYFLKFFYVIFYVWKSSVRYV